MHLCCWTNLIYFVCCCFCKKKKSTQRIKHLHLTKLNYVVIIAVLHHVKSAFTYLFVPATQCFKLRIKWFQHDLKFVVLLLVVLNHPIPSLSWFWRVANYSQCQDHTTHFFLQCSQPSECQIAPTWCHKSALFLASGHTHWPRPCGTWTLRTVAKRTFWGTGLCFVLSLNTLADTPYKSGKKMWHARLSMFWSKNVQYSKWYKRKKCEFCDSDDSKWSRMENTRPGHLSTGQSRAKFMLVWNWHERDCGSAQGFFLLC